MSSTDFLRAKIEGRKLSMVTCYDYTFARLLLKSAIDGILVGDKGRERDYCGFVKGKLQPPFE